MQGQSVQIEELRVMFEAGHHYLAGTISIVELNSFARHCADAAHVFRAHPALREKAEEWVTMINRRWNEMQTEPEPLSEEEFRAWLQEELIPYPVGSELIHFSPAMLEAVSRLRSRTDN